MKRSVNTKTEIILTSDEKPLAKLVSLSAETPQALLGSLVGVGETVGDLVAPFDDKWGKEQ